LTYIRIGIHSKAIEDCDQAIYINPDLLKARLFRARAYFNMAKPELARQALQETKELFPGQMKMIQGKKVYGARVFNQ
jgi:tetratricopeptide (TPR) repeat protein